MTNLRTTHQIVPSVESYSEKRNDLYHKNLFKPILLMLYWIINSSFYYMNINHDYAIHMIFNYNILLD